MIYLYVMACPDKTNFHVGYSIDLVNAVEFYKSLPAIVPDKAPCLVYLEGYTNVPEAKARFHEVFTMPTEFKIELVKTVNPDFTEFIPGVNVDI